MKTVAVIPALNEAKHIAGVVSKAKQYVNQVLVVDGGSTDDTVLLAIENGAEILYSQKGYGRQIRGGLLYAKRLGADVVVLLDSDGQHNPDEIPNMLKPILDSKADVVMGCRVGNMPGYRRFGNRLLTALCNIGSKFKPYDALTGYWALRIVFMPVLFEDKWGVAIELLVKSRNNGCRITTVDVGAIYHENYEDNSSASPFMLGLNLLLLVLKWRIKVEVLHEAS